MYIYREREGEREREVEGAPAPGAVQLKAAVTLAGGVEGVSPE